MVAHLTVLAWLRERVIHCACALTIAQGSAETHDYLYVQVPCHALSMGVLL